MGSGDPTTLAPGFRFHPTDEELVSYYLKRKICGKNFRVDAIAEIDIYRVEPWDLPALSRLKSRDLEWYFFSGLDKKYGNGSRTNRATGEGYWKTTGKDRPVHHRSRLVGMKKTLVYHLGRAPKGKRSNWVMHEYKLVDEALEKAGVSLEDCALCRIFQKSGSGPKNGEKYGAPLADEEWEKDEVHSTVPDFEEPFADDNEYIEQSDLDQTIDSKLAENVNLPLPNNFQHEDNNIHAENSRDISASEEYFPGENEYKPDLQATGDQQIFDFTIHNLNTANIVRNEHMAQPNEVSNESVDCKPEEPLLDSVGNNDMLDDGSFLDALDLWVPAEENPMEFGFPDLFVDDDIDIDIEQYLTFDAPPSLMSNDTDESSFTKENFYGPIPTVSQPQLELYSDSMAASSSTQAFEISKSTLSKSAIQYPWLSQASCLLGDIPAPPAFASELPSKDMTARLNAAVQSSSPIHVTAGMIRIRDSAAMKWSVDKIGNVNVLLSFDLPGDVNEEAGLSSLISTKMAASFSGAWLRSMLWFIAFAVSFKFGSFIFAK